MVPKRRASRAAANYTVKKEGFLSIPPSDYFVDSSKITFSNLHVECSDEFTYYRTEQDDMRFFSYTLPANHSPFYSYYLGSPYIKLKYYDAILDGKGNSYNLVITLTDFFFYDSFMNENGYGNDLDLTFLYLYNSNFLVYSTNFSSLTGGVGYGGSAANITFSVESGAGTLTDGTMIISFGDLNCPSVSGTLTGGVDAYQEGVRIVSGLSSDVYVESNTNFSDAYMANMEFVNGASTVDIHDTTLSLCFLGSVSGTKVHISNCNGARTAFNINSYALGSYTVKTQIRHQLKDGTFETYSDIADSVKTYPYRLYSDYSYTWERNADTEPETVYEDADPLSVSGTKLTEDKVFYMDVMRKSYTYRFHPNTPSGHMDSDVTNMQDNFTKLAENLSNSTVETPILSGYRFEGYNTSADGTGSSYAGNEEMLSDKDFYAQWKSVEYYVSYEANGGTDYNHETGEYTQNKTAGTMATDTFTFDIKGTLSANAFSREGYEFAGWNTKADGTGVSYPDKYDSVLNWASKGGITIPLYAQWKKKLGTETIKIISEETGNGIADIHLALWRKENGVWKNTGVTGVTDTHGVITIGNLHWFMYEWRPTKLPAGYKDMADIAFDIYPNCTAISGTLCSHTSGSQPSDGEASLSLSHERILYMKHAKIVCNSYVSEIIKGEHAPAFLYHISGMDVAGVAHEYDVMVQTNVATCSGTNEVPDVFAGTYEITQIPVSRYVLADIQNISNMVVSGMEVSADVTTKEKAEVKFLYTLSQYGGFGSMYSTTNQLKK